MKFVLALSLGFILADSPGLGIPLLQAEMGLLVLLPVWIVLPQLHSTSEHGLLSSPRRDELPRRKTTSSLYSISYPTCRFSDRSSRRIAWTFRP
jgi:hypothetical protein